MTTDQRRWDDADIIVVELAALGFGLLIGGAAGLVGSVMDAAWLPAGCATGGLLVIVRAVLRGRSRPWWRWPSPGPEDPDA